MTTANISVNIAHALSWAKNRINGVDARVLLCHTLDCSSAHLSAWPEQTLTEASWQTFQAQVERRQRGIPIAYLTGIREFYGRAFNVSPAVLIPRPETELLVELALTYFQTQSGVHVLDLGTGSGALAITLALELQQPDVTAIDYSDKALCLAMVNAARLGASVSLVQSDWFNALEGDLFHLIVANPPYVADDDEHLEQGDLRFEPRDALAAGPKGLDDLIHIVQHSPRYLESGGRLFLEHGYDQAHTVRGMLLDAGFTAIESWRDLAGIERVSGGKWEGKK